MRPQAYALIGRLRNQTIGKTIAQQRAFTLIELMIVVAIVAILAGIAYPSYMDQVRKGNRAKAQAFLMDVAQRQQSYLMVHRQYAQSLEQLGFDNGSGDLALGDELAKLDAVYDITGMSMGSVAGPPPSFNMTLPVKSGSLQDGDGSLCLANSGARGRHCGTTDQVIW